MFKIWLKVCHKLLFWTYKSIENPLAHNLFKSIWSLDFDENRTNHGISKHIINRVSVNFRIVFSLKMIYRCIQIQFKFSSTPWLPNYLPTTVSFFQKHKFPSRGSGLEIGINGTDPHPSQLRLLEEFRPINLLSINSLSD